MQRRMAVRGVIVSENLLLCVKLKSASYEPEDNYWCLPGGSVEDGETLHEALVREMVEETAIKPEIGKLLYINHFVLNDIEHLEFFFHIENADVYHDVDLSKASHGHIEIAEIGFIEPSKQHVMPEFLKTEDIASHIQNKNSVVKIFEYI